MKKIIIALFFFLFAIPCLAESKILINEFLIDPQPQQVELINIGTESANISNWIIDDDGGSSNVFPIPENTFIYPYSCFIFSGNFYLNKSSPDTIRLFNENSQLVNNYSYSKYPGANISFSRLPDGEVTWATGSASLGFYNKTNVSCLVSPAPILTPTTTIAPTISNQVPTGTWPTETLILTFTPIPQSYDNIYLSEAMVNPMTGEKEWIEIFNNNDYSVSLNNWYTDDIENGGSSPKSFSADISAKSYYVFNLSSSMFNNDGDSVRLVDNNKNLKDSFEYFGGDQGKTFGRTSLDSDDFCQQEPSNGTINNSCINPTSEPEIAKTVKLTSTPTKFIPVSIKPILVNQLISTKKIIVPTVTVEPGEVLGVSNKLLMNSSNNKSLVNTLLFISCSYSLLTMISILIKMRFIYEKIAKFLSSFVYPS